MLQWPHSGFHVHAGVGVPGDDAEVEQATYRSDKAEGPTAGTATVDPLEFLARLVTHIPEPGQAIVHGFDALLVLGSTASASL